MREGERGCGARFGGLALGLWLIVTGAGVSPAPASTDEIREELRRLRGQVEEQQRRIEELERELGKEDEDTGEAGQRAGYRFGYEDGFVLWPRNEEKDPFALRVNARMQFRYTYFHRDATSWTDHAGTTRTISRRSDFEIERGRLSFEGFFLDPRLGYYINIDADTDDGHDAIFHDFWVSAALHRALTLYAGKAFVPGSREWLDGSTRTRLSDRSMAATFFRPDRSLGLWAIGEPIPSLHYRLMVGNGFNTTNLEPEEIDEQPMGSGSLWWTFRDYGKGVSDLEGHSRLAARLGSSFTFARSEGEDDGDDILAEQRFLRLSDGTRLVEAGALAPGTQVDRFDVALWAVDAAWKWNGLSANAEYFFRWVDDIRASGGGIADDGFFDHGFAAEAGVFLIPHRLEINGRTSQIFGDFGDASEYAGGVNWFMNGTHELKVTADATWLDHNPGSSSGPNLRAGDDGLLVRTQLQAAF